MKVIVKIQPDITDEYPDKPEQEQLFKTINMCRGHLSQEQYDHLLLLTTNAETTLEQWDEAVLSLDIAMNAIWKKNMSIQKITVLYEAYTQQLELLQTAREWCKDNRSLIYFGINLIQTGLSYNRREKDDVNLGI
jgi:hypothetical protein